MAFDFDNTQARSHIPGLMIEAGRVTAAGVSGFDFTVDTKLGKVVMGLALTENDGLVAYATTGQTSSGKVTFTRVGPIATSADSIQYMVIGKY